MILKSRLHAYALKNKVKWEIVEQDYVLSWALKGLSEVPELEKSIVFKGGTALKKIYFGDYRFSQDLDFTIRKKQSLHDLEALVAQACDQITQTIQSYGENVELRSKPYMEKLPHPEGQKAFIIEARLPWHREFLTKAYAEFTFNEVLTMEPIKMPILNAYDEHLEGHIYCYPLEEIVAEKIRALLQFATKLHERGWGRSRVRDYYDIWRILRDYKNQLNTTIIPDLVEKKCKFKNVQFNGIDDIFQESLMLNFEKEWETWLKDIVPKLPDKTIVLNDLQIILSEIFPKNYT